MPSALGQNFIVISSAMFSTLAGQLHQDFIKLNTSKVFPQASYHLGWPIIRPSVCARPKEAVCSLQLPALSTQAVKVKVEMNFPFNSCGYHPDSDSWWPEQPQCPSNLSPCLLLPIYYQLALTIFSDHAIFLGKFLQRLPRAYRVKFNPLCHMIWALNDLISNHLFSLISFPPGRWSFNCSKLMAPPQHITVPTSEVWLSCLFSNHTSPSLLCVKILPAFEDQLCPGWIQWSASYL